VLCVPYGIHAGPEIVVLVHHQFALLGYLIQWSHFQVTIISVFKVIKYSAIKYKKATDYIVADIFWFFRKSGNLILPDIKLPES